MGRQTSFKTDMSSYLQPPYIFNIKAISVNQLLWIKDILDFIYKGIA